MLVGIIAKAGLGPNDVRIQPQQVSITPFVNGDVDVCAATVYNEFYAIAQRLGRDNLRTFIADDSGITVPRDTFIASEKVMRDSPEIPRAFLRASIRGRKDAFANPDAALDTLFRVAPQLDRAHEDCLLGENKRLVTSGSTQQNGLLWLDMQDIRSAHDFFLQSKVISKPVDLEKAFDLGPLRSIPLADRLA